MRKNRRQEIIYDILALYQKYGEQEIKFAIEAIRNGEALDSLLTLATVSKDLAARVPETKTTPTKSKTKARSPKDRFYALIETLENSQGEHTEQIIMLIKAITTRQLLHSVASLREFSNLLDIIIPDTRVDRYVVAKKIGEALLSRSIADQEHFFKTATQLGGGTSSLDEWSSIIVKK